MSFSLFADASLDPASGTGFGAWLTVTGALDSPDRVVSAIHTKRFAGTTSSRLELLNVIWALQSVPAVEVAVYSDAQSVIGLIGRRPKLEAGDFLNGNGRLLRHHELYREFFRVVDAKQCSFVKVKGHKPARERNEAEQLFHLVDKAARTALRDELKR